MSRLLAIFVRILRVVGVIYFEIREHGIVALAVAPAEHNLAECLRRQAYSPFSHHVTAVRKQTLGWH